MSRVRRAWLLAAVALLVARPAEAQNVRPVVNGLARSWGHDAGSIASASSRSGVSVEIDGSRHGPLNPRQVSAWLRDLFAERETVRAEPGMAKVSEGSPGQAFGEVMWTARMRGTTQDQRSTVMLAFVLENDRWRITEIRVRR